MNDKHPPATHHWSLVAILLFPFSLLYGIITFFRNKLYDCGCLSSVRFEDICVISVGNITVGGTGKTPHVEYLVRMLSPNYKVAVLSRGYKRKTKGFVLADMQSTAADIGDEPCQIKQKFPHIEVAVDVDRVEGIHKLRAAKPGIQVVLLDDAFQYRRIVPSLSVLLADYNRPLYHDSVFPGGRMREWACSARRADLMLITKSPVNLPDDEKKEIAKRYACFFSKNIYFTTIMYGAPCSIFQDAEHLPVEDIKTCDVLLITGIATPKILENHLRPLVVSLQTLVYPDHHPYSESDIKDIFRTWENMSSGNRLILTTEKDAVRLRKLKIPGPMSSTMYYMPIEIDFIGEGKQDVERMIHTVVSKLNTRQ